MDAIKPQAYEFMDDGTIAVDIHLELLGGPPDDDHILRFEAAHLRRGRFGEPEALVRVLMNNRTMSYSQIRIDHDEERERLKKSAWEHFGKNGMASGGYPEEYLKNDLDLFCEGLWRARLVNMGPTLMAGVKTRTGPVFLLEPYIIKGGGTILYGPPGRGKSNVALLLAVCITHGITTFWPIKKARVLFINLERSEDSLKERLANINESLGIDREATLLTMNARGSTLADVEDACRLAIGQHAIDLIILDSISRAGVGTMVGDEPANLIADMLNRLCPTWLALGHTPKGNEDTLYGSQMFVAAADLTIKLISQQDPDGPLGVGLELDKKNDIGSKPMEVLAFEFDHLGLTGIRRGNPGEFPDVDERRKTTVLDDMIQTLREASKPMTATELAAVSKRGRSGIVTLLEKRTDVFVRVGKDPRDARGVLYGLLGTAPEGMF